MGSWYDTCALSFLPILPDSNIKIIHFRMDDFDEGTVGLPVSGKYTDFGSCERDFVLFNQKYVSSHDYDAMAYVDAVVWQELAEVKLNDHFDLIKDRLIAWARDVKGHRPSSLKEIFNERDLWIDRYDPFRIMNSNPELSGLLRCFSALANAIRENSISEKDLLAILQDATDFIVVNRIRSLTRRSWSGKRKKGQQYLNLDLHLKLCEIVASTIKNRIEMESK